MTTLAAAHTGIELIDRDHGIYRSLADRLQAGLARGLGDGEAGQAGAGQATARQNIAKVLKKIHDDHIKYFDAVLCHYLTDKYALTIVDDGLGI